MPHRKREYLKASELEKAVFLDVIDARVREFLGAAESEDAESEVVDDLRLWAGETRVRLRDVFSEWYDANVLGTDIPKDVIIPAPRQDRIYRGFSQVFSDAACEVCGDTRVFNIAHIIPRSTAGPDEEWNLMRLCADHHYLFDEAQLTEEEWHSIDWSSKDPRAREHAMRHRLPAHERWWQRQR